MKFEHIIAGRDNVVGIRILEKDIATTDPVRVAQLLAEYGAIVFKQVTTPIKEYNDWQLEFAYHQHGKLWCNSTDYPIFYRVTNKQLTENEEGLFGHGELDWHQNILFVPNAEEIVSLYGLDVEGAAPTTLANSIPLWRNLSQEDQDFFSRLRFCITNKSHDTYDKKMAHYVLPTAEQQDFDRKRSGLHISNAVNFDPKNKDLYPPLEFVKKNFLRFKPIHPLGTDGLYFPMLNIEYVADENKVMLPDHREVYERIKALYIGGDYTYTHHWEKGDIFFMEQLTTIHKREPMDATLPRELLRTASWYKTPLRTSFKAALNEL